MLEIVVPTHRSPLETAYPPGTALVVLRDAGKVLLGVCERTAHPEHANRFLERLQEAAQAVREGRGSEPGPDVLANLVRAGSWSEISGSLWILGSRQSALRVWAGADEVAYANQISYQQHRLGPIPAPVPEPALPLAATGGSSREGLGAGLRLR